MGNLHQGHKLAFVAIPFHYHSISLVVVRAQSQGSEKYGWHYVTTTTQEITVVAGGPPQKFKKYADHLFVIQKQVVLLFDREGAIRAPQSQDS